MRDVAVRSSRRETKTIGNIKRDSKSEERGEEKNGDSRERKGVRGWA